jgi:hypothetical protein
LNETAGLPFSAFDEYVGEFTSVPVNALALLSRHAVMADPAPNVSVDESAASNHNAHPGTDTALNPEWYFEFVMGTIADDIVLLK